MLTLGTLGLVAAHLLSWGAVCHALLHKRDPRSALGWIVTVLFLPGVGIVLYCLFGISRAESLAARLMRKMAAIENQLQKELSMMARLNKNAGASASAPKRKASREGFIRIFKAN